MSSFGFESHNDLWCYRGMTRTPPFREHPPSDTNNKYREKEGVYDQCSMPFGSPVYDGRSQSCKYGKRRIFHQLDCVKSTLSEGRMEERTHALIFILCKLNKSIFNERVFHIQAE